MLRRTVWFLPSTAACFLLAQGCLFHPPCANTVRGSSNSEHKRAQAESTSRRGQAEGRAPAAQGFETLQAARTPPVAPRPGARPRARPLLLRLQ